MTIAEAAHIHFVGIGGAGMSAIALVLLERGRPVSGSDAKEGPALDLLRARGAEVVVGHDADNVSGADQVVVSNAVPAENVEVQRAHSTGARVITRGEALAELLAPTSAVIVAGTHGKTTTAAMIVAIAKAAGLDPTYLIGAGFGEDHTNAHSGRDDLAVAESDESDGSFLLLAPKIGVVTNVDADHLDHWASEAEYRRAFVDFVDRIREDGSLVAPSAEGDLLARGTESGLNLVSFGPDGDIRAGDVTYEATGSRFTVRLPSEELEVNLRVPGAHNIENALAATGAAVVLGIESEAIKRGLETYRGVDRRFQLRGSPGGRMVVDDYAHHPVEVRAVLAATRAPGASWHRVVAVFQPHRYSRTKAFASEFGGAFASADRVIITDVYGAGEPPMEGVTGKLIADAVCERLPGRPVAYIPDRGQLVGYLAATTRPGDLVLTLGAGDVTSLGDELERALVGE